MLLYYNSMQRLDARRNMRRFNQSRRGCGIDAAFGRILP